MSQVRQSRAIRRPVVVSGPVVRRIPPPIQTWQEVDALLALEASWPRPIITHGPTNHAYANQRPTMPTVAVLNDEAALAETAMQYIPWKRAWAPLPHTPLGNTGVSSSDDLGKITHANPAITQGRPISPPHVAHPYTTQSVFPEPPPPPDVVVVRMQGPRRLPGTARTTRALNVRLDEGWEDVPPQILTVAHQRRAALPLQVVHQTPVEALPLDEPAQVTRGARARPNPTAVTLGQQHLNDFQLAEFRPDTVQVRQVARPWVPLPRMPLGAAQEQPVDTDVAPQQLNVPHQRRAALPPMNVQSVPAQYLPTDAPVWQTPPPPGKKIPPLTPTQVRQYPHDLALLESNPARLYWTFGVNAVFPAVTVRAIALYAVDTTTQSFFSFDSTTHTLVATDTTAKALKS